MPSIIKRHCIALASMYVIYVMKSGPMSSAGPAQVVTELVEVLQVLHVLQRILREAEAARQLLLAGHLSLERLDACGQRDSLMSWIELLHT